MKKTTLPLLLLAACLAVLASCVTPSGAGPAGSGELLNTPLLEALGLRVVSPPAATAPQGESEFVVTSDQDLELLPMIQNNQKGTPAGGRITTTSAAGTWTVHALYPRSGPFELLLMGKKKGAPDSQYGLLARWHVEAQVSGEQAAAIAARADSAAAVGTEKKPYETWSYFKEYGISVRSGPTGPVGAEAEVVAGAAPDVTLSAMLMYKGSNRSINDTTTVERVGEDWRIRTCFPASGDYQLAVFGKRGSDPKASAYGVAAWNLRAEVPEGPLTYSAFAEQGLSLVSGPSPEAAAEAEIRLEGGQELELLASLARKNGAPVMDTVSVERAAGGWRIVAAFADSGEYVLRLSGRPAGVAKSEYRPLGRWPLKAVVPEGKIIHSRFAEYGLALASEPPLAVAAEAEYLLSGSQDLHLYCRLRDRATGEQVLKDGGAVVGKTKGGWKLLVFFPGSGDYRLELSGRRAEEKGYTYHPLAHWDLRTTVEQRSPAHVLHTPSDLHRVRLSAVGPTEGPQWFEDLRCLDDSPIYQGTLAEPLTLQLDLCTFQLKKGQQVLLAAGDGVALNSFAFDPPGAQVLKLGKNELRLAAGARVAVGYSGELSGILPAPKGAFTLNKVSYTAEGLLYFGQAVKDTPGMPDRYFYFTLARDTPVTVGGTKLNVPAGSEVFFDALTPRPYMVIPTREMRFTSKGKEVTVPAGWLVSFDEQGAVLTLAEAK